MPPRIRAGRSLLHVLFVGPIAVIVAPARGPETSIEHALRRQHTIVLELADRVDPLLPARFGSRIAARRLDAKLRPSIAVLKDALEHVRGCQQMTIRLIGPRPAIDPPRAAETGTAYLTQRRAAGRAIPAVAAPLSAAVQPFVIDERVQPGRAGIRATLFHLVRREEVDPYRRALESSLPAISPLTAGVTGPWPPFAFAPELSE